MKLQLSNALAVCGAISVCVGIGMFSRAGGLIALGLFLIVGAVATAGSERKA